MTKYIHLLAVTLIFYIPAFCQDKSYMLNIINDLQFSIDSIKQEYVPDRRLNVFDIEISSNANKPVIKGYTSDSDAYSNLKTLIRSNNLIDSVELLPSTELGNKIYGVVTLSVADVRTKPDFSSEMATQAILGTPIHILQKDDWYRIQTPDGYIGWTQLANFQPMTKDEYARWNKAPKIVFTDYFGFSYQEPDKSSQTVSDLVIGNFLKQEGESGDFYRVSYPDSRIAYILKSQAKPYQDWVSSIVLTGENIVKKAFTLMGIPYVWGGTSAKGMDCSGFTKTVLFMHGVILMRDASQQAFTGIPVDISNGYCNLQTGDMLFFGKRTEDAKEERIRHVGFYVGNNEFIHASGSVRVGSLDPNKPNYDEKNATEFIRATRIIGAVDKDGSNIWSVNNNPFYQ